VMTHIVEVRSVDPRVKVPASPRGGALVKTVIVAVLVGLVSADALFAAERGVTRRELGTPPGTQYSVPTAVNNKGVVVGTTHFLLPDDSQDFTAFVWSPRTGFELFLLGTRSVPTDINDRGQIVGFFTSVTDSQDRGFMWSRTDGFTDLGDFLPRAINDHGVIAGDCESRYPCIGPAGAILRLPIVSDGEGVRGFASGINKRGEVVGGVFVPDEGYRAALWTRRGALVRLEGASGDTVYARDINDRGEIVGQVSNEFSPSFIVRWDRNGRLQRVDPQEAFALGIDTGGTIAAIYFNGVELRVILVRDDGRVIDVGAGLPQDFNDKGQVVGVDLADVRALVWTVDPKFLRSSQR